MSTTAAKRTKEQAQRIQALYKAINNKDEKTVTASYAPDVVINYVDFVPSTKSQGRDEVIHRAVEYWKGFPNAQTELDLLLLNGQEAVTVIRSVGTNTGEYWGQAATNRTIGTLGGCLLQLNSQGQVAQAAFYGDQATWLGQMGMIPGAQFRPAVESTGNPPVIVIEAGDEKERANVELIKKMITAFNKHGTDEVMNFYSDDAVVKYIAERDDYQGKKAIGEALNEFYAMDNDIKRTVERAWGVGDYVVTLTKVKATNTGPRPGGMGKATNKKYKVDELAIYKLADGKITEHWAFANSTAVAAQLGLLDLDSMAGEAE